jgi:cysteine desulfuration protein SufE
VARLATAPGSAPRPAGLKLDFPSPSARAGPDPPADISARAQSSIAAFAMAYRRPYISAMSETMTTTASEAMAIDEIVDNFSLLEEWDDRYRYLIELGRGLTPLTERDRTEANKVQGCASQVWLATTVRPNGANGPVLTFCGDSDAHIVRGLIAILLATLSDKPAREILSTDAVALFERLGLREHLTPQRSNGFRSMVERIRSDARAALASAA